MIENRGRVCVTFQYHMWGIDVDRLFVYSERTGIDVNRFIQKPQNQVRMCVYVCMWVGVRVPVCVCWCLCVRV